MDKSKGSAGQLNGRDSSGGTVVVPPEDDVLTLNDLGLNKNQSSKYQQLANKNPTISDRVHGKGNTV